MRKNFSFFIFHFPLQKGFTLIEMIVVASIIAILSAGSIAAFSTFSKSQTINIATSGVTTMLNTARSRAQSQVKPGVTNCNTRALDGYGVRICGVVGAPCAAEKTYRLYVVCGGTWNLVESETLPTGTDFDNDSDYEFFFRILSGGVDNATTPKTITLFGNDQTKTITVTSVGSITSN